MIEALTLSLTLALAGAPADLSPTLAVEQPAPVQCADVSLSSLANILSPAFLALGDIGQQTVTCHEDCDELPDIWCTGNTCSAVSRNCPSEVGHVVCDGHRLDCSQPCPVCTDGDFRILFTGQCCPGCDGTGYKELQKCINGQWVTQSIFCAPAPQCPICP